MWYDRSRMRMLFFFGAALVLIGLGVVMMDHRIPGAVLVCIGIGTVIIAFAVLRIHMMVAMKKR